MITHRIKHIKTDYLTTAKSATLLMLFAVVALFSQAQRPTIPMSESLSISVDSITVEILFPVGKTQIDSTYMDNGANLKIFARQLKALKDDPNRSIENIYITGYASPEGSYKLNERLARERATNMGRYIRGIIDVPESQISIFAGGIDWKRLESLVMTSSLSNRDEVLSILTGTPEFTYNSRGVMVENRNNKLKALNNGRTWAWLLKNVYPQLRSSSSKIICYITTITEPEPIVEPADETQEPLIEQTIVVADTTELPTVPATIPEQIQAQRYVYPIAALRSNLLLPLLNIGVELPIGNRWSVAADYYYPWIWPKSDNKNCFELIFVSAEARYWFGKKHDSTPENRQHRLTGHSLGIYGAWGYYDIERNFKGHQGHGWSAGVDYLFAVPIAKGKLHLEFEVAIGAVWSNAQPYHVEEPGGELIRDKQHRKRFSYIGPTKLGVSLVVPLWRSVKPKAVVLP